MTFEEHITERGGSFISKIHPFFIDYTDEIITFPLWTTNGRLVGYQRYFWKADKLKNNSDLGRYYTYRSKEALTAWGLEYLDLFSREPLYIVEGIWDAISILNTGRRALAVLSNNPKSLVSWFRTLPCKTIAVCDGDEAGKKLAGCCDYNVILPEGFDCNNISREELEKVLNEYKNVIRKP